MYVSYEKKTIQLLFVMCKLEFFLKKAVEVSVAMFCS